MEMMDSLLAKLWARWEMVMMVCSMKQNWQLLLKKKKPTRLRLILHRCCKFSSRRLVSIEPCFVMPCVTSS